MFHRIQEVTRSLVEAQAAFSAYVDYPDDDIPELEPTALAAVLEQAGRVLSQLLSTFDAGRILREGVDTAIVGSPNVGKSTLMNLLAGCERSIVTSAAGTTRDIVEETVRLGNVTLRLADTAGIRDAADAAEAAGVERAREAPALGGARPRGVRRVPGRWRKETSPCCGSFPLPPLCCSTNLTGLLSSTRGRYAVWCPAWSAYPLQPAGGCRISSGRWRTLPVFAV